MTAITRFETGKRFRQPVTLCSMKNCRQRTHGGKPFCIEHYDLDARVQEVLAGIGRRQAEVSAVESAFRKRERRAEIVKAVPVNGMVCSEIMGVLIDHDEVTLGLLTREMVDIKFELVRYFVLALGDAGSVKIGRTKSTRACTVSLPT